MAEVVRFRFLRVFRAEKLFFRHLVFPFDVVQTAVRYDDLCQGYSRVRVDFDLPYLLNDILKDIRAELARIHLNVPLPIGLATGWTASIPQKFRSPNEGLIAKSKIVDPNWASGAIKPHIVKNHLFDLQ